MSNSWFWLFRCLIAKPLSLLLLRVVLKHHSNLLDNTMACGLSRIVAMSISTAYSIGPRLGELMPNCGRQRTSFPRDLNLVLSSEAAWRLSCPSEFYPVVRCLDTRAWWFWHVLFLSRFEIEGFEIKCKIYSHSWHDMSLRKNWTTLPDNIQRYLIHLHVSIGVFIIISSTSSARQTDSLLG